VKIITYSDLHLEFGTKLQPPQDSDADLMILAGDVITFKDFMPLGKFLKDWKKPVLYVAGNHEYYTNKLMSQGNERFKAWLAENHQNVTFLQDEEISIDGVHFFGGTMWTDFDNSDIHAMLIAKQQMNDYRVIMHPDNRRLKPEDTVAFHNNFIQKLIDWFEKDLQGARVVITHNAPTLNRNTKYNNSPLRPAFNSLDMEKIIEKYQPNLWIYDHTHECDDQMIGDTRIISNQLGYPGNSGHFECIDFDVNGMPTNL